MGREVKRVSPSFNWPLNQTWEGYLNPWYECRSECPQCHGSGLSYHANSLKNEWYGADYDGGAPSKFDPVAYHGKKWTPESPALRSWVTAKVDRSIIEAKEGRSLNAKTLEFDGHEDWYTENGRFTREQAIEKETLRLMDIYNEAWCHNLNDEDVKALIDNGRLWDLTRDGHIPTADEVNDWSIGGFGHDSTNSFVCIKARVAREGRTDYLCPACKGDGDLWMPEDAKQYAENWNRTEPPAGEAYQIWETVSEGSPISPAFLDPQILAEWMANSPPWGAARSISAEQWLKFIVGDGWAPSMAFTNGRLVSGVEAVVENKS